MTLHKFQGTAEACEMCGRPNHDTVHNEALATLLIIEAVHEALGGSHDAAR